MPRLLGTIAVLSLTFASMAHAQTPALESRLAYFSPQRAFASSADGKLAAARLSELQATRAKEVEARNQQIQKLQSSLEASAVALDEAARRLRDQEIVKFQVDLDRFIQDAQAEFAGVQRDFEAAFLAKLRPALDAVAKDRALLIVLNQDAGLIAWADPTLDVTAEVVARLNPVK